MREDGERVDEVEALVGEDERRRERVQLEAGERRLARHHSIAFAFTSLPLTAPAKSLQ